MAYERDFIGYGNMPPKFLWPGGKTLALSIVVNYEEGGEHSYPVDGIIESVGEFGPADIATRDVGMESVYEYGQRVAIWRFIDIFKREKIKVTFFAVAKALELNPAAAKAIIENGHEICDHGYRWTELYRLTYDEEKEEIKKSVSLIEKITGKKPVGFYAREPSENTLEILKEFKNFIYDSDAYNDDLPYFYKKTGMLIVPYTPDANDFHFLYPMHRFSNAKDFFIYLKDTFDILYKESRISPKLMNVGLHVRISGRPGRFVAVEKFIKYAKKHNVWIATREEIANFWIKNFGENK